MTSQFSKIVLHYKHKLPKTFQRDNTRKMYRIKSRIHTSFHRPYLQKIKLLNLSRTTLQHSTWFKYKKSRTELNAETPIYTQLVSPLAFVFDVTLPYFICPILRLLCHEYFLLELFFYGVFVWVSDATFTFRRMKPSHVFDSDLWLVENLSRTRTSVNVHVSIPAWKRNTLQKKWLIFSDKYLIWNTIYYYNKINLLLDSKYFVIYLNCYRNKYSPKETGSVVTKKLLYKCYE